MNENDYLLSVIEQIPRLIGLLNRNPLSVNYGCFDRDYWQYKIVDFPCCRKQEAVLTLTLLYNFDNPNNPYYNNESILELINAGILFWCKIQEKNGSFNEWYPNESSFVGTAFSAYAVSETLILLKSKIRNKRYIMSKLKKSVDWLIKTKENQAQNQVSGALLAIYNYYLLTKNIEYQRFAKSKLDFLYTSQNKEGWFLEYGGFDVGYSSLLISYLGKYYLKSKDAKALEILKKSIGFIKYFVYPDFSFGGSIGSRNTQYVLPDGFEITSELIEDSNQVCYILRNFSKNKMLSFEKLDDRYLCYNLYNYLQSILYTTYKFKKVNINNFDKYFKEANIYIKNNTNFYVVMNLNKSTCHVLFKKSKKEFFDNGISIVTNKNKKMYSSYLNDKTKLKINDQTISIFGNFSKIPDRQMKTFNYLVLRVFQLTFGKVGFISRNTKSILRKILITKKHKSYFNFVRSIEINKDEILFNDVVYPSNNIKYLIFGEPTAYIYVPSSNYFVDGEIEINKKLRIKNSHVNSKIVVKRVLDVQGNIKNQSFS
ncbi:hypothetical protein J4438_01055 [Candidatus Woesearchaeota archaeon]|nr:hypothetical protein [Candidatus Woesearchaeota archaeon]